MAFLKSLAAALALFSAPAPAAPASGEIIAIVGADILPMTREERLDDQTVLLSGDRILAVGPAGEVAIPDGARRIDGRGRVLMPGLVDMHIHLAPVAGEPGDAAHRALSVMLAHGVTTARTMAGSPANLEVRSAIESGELVGPRLYVAAPALHSGNTATPDSARTAAQAASSAGYDLIKSHHIEDPSTWQALQDEAARLGLETAGHVANPVGLDRALAAGQQVEHLDGFLHALIPADSPERALNFGQIPPPPVIAAVSASEADLDSLARRVADSGNWQVPTLSLFERIVDPALTSEALRAGADMRFIPEPALRAWAEQKDQFAAQSGYDPQKAAAFIDLRRRIVAALHRSGVALMAGSDTAQAFHIWGPGLHREIESLAAAGLSPLEALRSATIVPRDYLRSLPSQGSSRKWAADFGTVEPGARADLLLLGGDPSLDLAALGQIEAVIAAGRVLERADLDRMLEAAAEAAGAVGAPG